ncbi:MAG: RNA-binding S4 domain-containing protein [Candidatus Enteromonas sp.]|nr:RNA-binding S4 domain-containing protein [Candidatus Enteromonas sp.]
MRIDKFLQMSRLVKRRTVAKELCLGSKVLVNGEIAKPSTEVVPGTVITLHLGRRTVVAEVVEIPIRSTKESAPSTYRIIEDAPKERQTEC